MNSIKSQFRIDLILFLIKHSEFANNFISSTYPFSRVELQEFKSIVNWEYLSVNEWIEWDLKLYKEFKGWLNLELFSSTSPVFANSYFLDAIKKDIPWKGSNEDMFLSNSIALNKNINWTEDYIKKYSDLLNFSHLSTNTNLNWTEQLIDRFQTRWNWENLGSNSSVHWDLRLINKYFKNIDFSSLWVVYNLSYTKDIKLIESYHKLLDWKVISQNPYLPWKEENLLKKWRKFLDWRGLAFNKHLHENFAFFQDNLKIWESDPLIYFKILSSVPTIRWSDDLIARYCEYWDWEQLCQNEGIIWDRTRIEKFCNYVKWGGWAKTNDNSEISTGGLIFNRSLPWSIDFINEYKNYIDLQLIDNNDFWSKAFKPFVDKRDIGIILRLL